MHLPRRARTVIWTTIVLLTKTGAAPAAGRPAPPLVFERNCGQAAPEVEFILRTPGYTALLGHAADVIYSAGVPFGTRVLGGGRRVRATGMDPLGAEADCFVGNNPSFWRTHIATYAKVRYESVYPGIDMIYYTADGQLEYDFVVAAGADPSQIRLRIDGAGGVEIDSAGDLTIRAGNAFFRHRKPHMYQE